MKKDPKRPKPTSITALKQARANLMSVISTSWVDGYVLRRVVDAHAVIVKEIKWREEMKPLLDRIEARSRFLEKTLILKKEVPE